MDLITPPACLNGQVGAYETMQTNRRRLMTRYFLSTLTVLASTGLAFAAEKVPNIAHAATEAGHDAAAHAGHADPSPFNGSVWQAIAALLVFGLTLIILKKFAWGPILGGLQDRENKIKGDLQQAEDAAKAAIKTLDEYKAKVLAANEEARKIIEQSKKDAQMVADSIKAQTEAEITQMKNRATADITSAKELAINEVYAQTAMLATEVASKILRKNLSADDQKKLVEESIAAIKQTSRN
jgi:F-type H+-transporting ATPase subunit b